MSDTIYNTQFYDKQSQESFESGVIVLKQFRKLLGNKFKLDSVVDFGCGVGSWLAAAKNVGFKQVLGTDGIYVPSDKLMVNKEEFAANNLAEPESIQLPQAKFDLAMTLEVAEHLPENMANGFVKKITATSDLVLFSAAIPYQGGMVMLTKIG